MNVSAVTQVIVCSYPVRYGGRAGSWELAYGSEFFTGSGVCDGPLMQAQAGVRYWANLFFQEWSFEGTTEGV